MAQIQSVRRTLKTTRQWDACALRGDFSGKALLEEEQGGPWLRKRENGRGLLLSLDQ